MRRSSSLRPVNHTRLSDQAYEALRDSILRRELLPGHRLDLDALQRQLDISRTPLKEAINRLATDGLVTIIPRRGSYVTKLTAKDVAERLDARLVLEIGAIGQILSNLTEEHVSQLRRLYIELKSFSTPDQVTAEYFHFLNKDREYHRSMVLIAGNELLMEIYDGLNLNLQMAMVFYLVQDKGLERVDREHHQILQALESRDAESLKIAITDHIRSSKKAIVTGIEEQDRQASEEALKKAQESAIV